jgi:NAD(P)-dependent dehydrogenase (short-subunit alcohol dehydrogenase family)
MSDKKFSIAIIGAGGGIGSEFVRQFSEDKYIEKIYAFTGSDQKFTNDKVIINKIDIENEDSIKQASEIAGKDTPLDLVIVAVGMLHQDKLMPEKTIKNLSKENFQQIYNINTIAPAIIAKHFLPKLNKDSKSIFTALSARVGSISDNKLGGWYAYRASKSALNMILKNLSIEINRSNKNAVIIGLHPGTVDSKLSKPFQAAVKEDKLFTAEYSVGKLITVIKNSTHEDSGKIFDYEGAEIEY